jgi:flagellar biosynthesis chaperone FliJ
MLSPEEKVEELQLLLDSREAELTDMRERIEKLSETGNIEDGDSGGSAGSLSHYKSQINELQKRLQSADEKTCSLLSLI